MNSDHDARYWWNRAKEVRLAALGMKSPTARSVMLELAAAYLRMVERAEDRIEDWRRVDRDGLQS